MDRRQFLKMGLVLSFGMALSGCVPRIHSPANNEIGAAEFHLRRRYAETKFGKIAYFEHGRGEAALFLHGFPLNSFQWRGAIARLSDDRRCIAPDFLAMGYTEVAEGQSVAPAAQVAMIVSLLDILSISNFDLIGNDSGGAIAQLLAAQFPDRVRTLLLTNCDSEIDSPPSALLPVIELSKSGKFVDQWLAPWLANKQLARSKEGIGGMCYVDSSHPTDEAIDYYFTPLVSSPQRKAQVHAYAIALEQNALLGIEASLKRSKIPTRIVWGMADTIFSQSGADYLATTFGNSRGLRQLPDRKLFWPEELPDVIAEEARKLWPG